MSLYNNIFDAHAHYDDKWFDDDRFELLENIHTKGVCGIVNNAVDLETAKTCIEYAEKYDFMYAAVGFHPENLENIPGRVCCTRLNAMRSNLKIRIRNNHKQKTGCHMTTCFLM